jgi:hypothetical protein
VRHDEDVVMFRRAGIAALVLSLISCTSGATGPVTREGVTLIRHTFGPGGAYPSALAIGTLTVQAGCVALRSDGSDSAFVLWPGGYDFANGSDGLQVVDGGGNLIGVMGDEVSLGGGYTELPKAQDLTDGAVPSSCRVDGERYFLTSGPA